MQWRVLVCLKKLCSEICISILFLSLEDYLRQDIKAVQLLLLLLPLLLCHPPMRKIVVSMPAEGHQGQRGVGITVGLNTTGSSTHITAVAMNQTAAAAAAVGTATAAANRAKGHSCMFSRLKTTHVSAEVNNRAPC
jgi:type IV secretory pathway TrbL component